MHLTSGQELGDHQVKEAALLVVVDGQVRVEAGGASVDGRAGTVVRFEPDERHSVVAERSGLLAEIAEELETGVRRARHLTEREWLEAPCAGRQPSAAAPR